MSHWSSSKPLLLPYCQYWILTRIPHRYHMVDLCHEVPIALNLQVQTLLMLQLFRDGLDIGVDQLKALNLGLDGS